MRQANESPFGLNFLEPAQQKLAESSHLLNLPKYRLHDAFGQSVNSLPLLRLKFALHPFDHALRQRPTLSIRRILSVVLVLVATYPSI
jgi:hypothetical protein